MKFMTSKKFKTIKIIAPIYEYGLILINPLILEKDIKIRRINYPEEPELIEENLKLPSFKYSCITEIRYTFDPRDINEPFPNIGQLLAKIEIALRIFNGGAIGFAGIISQPKILPFPMVLSRVAPTGENKYKIDKDKLKEFPEFYKKFKIAYSKKQVAFDWFSKSYFDVPANKFIDYCICLENLFVPPNENRKKSFILQGIILLNIDVNKNKIETLIDYRNAIIHADSSKQHKILKDKIWSTYMFINNYEEMLRKILQIYIEKQW